MRINTMRCTLATLLAAAALPLWPTLLLAQSADIQFRHDYNETRKEAEKKGLPVLIYVTSDSCYWCMRLQQETFSDPTVARMMNERFVLLKVNAAKSPALAEALKVRSYPTIIMAGPDGKILSTVEGFRDASRFYDTLQSVNLAVANPDWMVRDYQIAVKAINEHDFSKGVALLKAIGEDGKARPIQVNAATLLKQVEQQAAGELAQAKKMLDKGKTNEASAMLTRLVKDYAGTQAAPEAAGLLTSMVKSPELRGPQRSTRARELLTQARDDYRTEQWLCCLDRCDVLISNFGDLPEATDALQMASAIRSNPEWMQRACESMSARLAEMYLGLAETWLQKGQPQQAMLCLERVIRTFPGTRQAETAQYRLSQIQGLPTQRTGFQNSNDPK
jgi:thioredoxin-like negative regulator of GroEL